MRFFENAIVPVCLAPLIFSAGGYAKIGFNKSVCGLSNGATLGSELICGLCSTGTTSIMSGSGPRTWNCAGAAAERQRGARQLSVQAWDHALLLQQVRQPPSIPTTLQRPA